MTGGSDTRISKAGILVGDGPGTCGLASVISPTCSGALEAGNSVGDGVIGCEMTWVTSFTWSGVTAS